MKFHEVRGLKKQIYHLSVLDARGLDSKCLQGHAEAYRGQVSTFPITLYFPCVFLSSHDHHFIRHNSIGLGALLIPLYLQWNYIYSNSISK